jgi:polysaccharide biosynthesis/export protein
VCSPVDKQRSGTSKGVLLMRCEQLAKLRVRTLERTLFVLVCLPGCILSQQTRQSRADVVPGSYASERPASPRSGYVLGPEDQISISVTDADEIGVKPVRIDLSGFIRVPLIGRVKAAGLTLEQLENELTRHLKPYIHEPDVSVAIVEFRSQPVSVLGAVKNPGIYQVQGRKTLLEMLSLAGGLDNAAGNRITITRRAQWGPLPLNGASESADGQVSVAEVPLKTLIEARAPEQNIAVYPHDIISVPRGELVYVIGQVPRSGGFVLNERESMSVLQAVSLAGGLDRFAAGQKARILRRSTGVDRMEIPIDVNSILNGKTRDEPLRADDILFIPNNAAKRAAVRAAEAAVQVGTGIAIWR